MEAPDILRSWRRPSRNLCPKALSSLRLPLPESSVTSYILPTWLPIPGAELNKAYITLPTVTLPNNVCSIWSPVPYAIFTCYKYLGPFLDHSAVHSGPLVPPPHPASPLPDSIPSDGTSFPLPLLIQVCGLHHQLPHLQEEEAAKAWDTFPHKMPLERELKAALRSLPRFLTQHSPLFSPFPSDKHAVERALHVQYIFIPLLSSDSISSSNTDLDCCGMEDEEIYLGWELDRSDDPPPHCIPAAYTATIWQQDPSTFTWSGTLIPMRHACPLPFNRGFPENYVNATIHYAKCLHKNLKMYQHLLYNKDRTVCSNILISYPPSINFSRTNTYKLHV